MKRKGISTLGAMVGRAVHNRKKGEKCCLATSEAGKQTDRENSGCFSHRKRKMTSFLKLREKKHTKENREPHKTYGYSSIIWFQR